MLLVILNTAFYNIIWHFNYILLLYKKKIINRIVPAFFCIIECREGWYDMNCTQLCVGHCKDSVTCNHVTGHCDRGCAVGWKGDLCDEGISCNFTLPLYLTFYGPEIKL